MATVPPAAIAIDADKRQAERRPFFCKVQLRANTQSIECRSLDISTGGIAVIADVNLPLGQNCRLQFPLPTPDGHDRPVELHGRVLNTVLTKHGFRLGLGFVGTDMPTQEMLKRFLNG
jgi:hypothetical protein